MKLAQVLACSTTLLALTLASGHAAEPVTVDNFARAETDLYLGSAVKDAGGIGKFLHHREPMNIDKQVVIRANRDTLYSAATFDLDAAR